MKKLYSKGKVHPSPPPPAIADNLLSLLPAAILTLTVALSPEEKEVLAYLISCSGTSTNNSGHRNSGLGGGSSGRDHPPQFHCNCFRCYMSFWVRWDTSPNRQLIHQILDEYEDGIFHQKKNVKVKKERRKKVSNVPDGEKPDSGESESVEASGKADVEVAGEDVEEGLEKGSMRKLVSFIGERIWGVWGI